jgi:hypothetical protein
VLLQTGVPYITGMPQVCHYDLGSDLVPVLLVLASDGVWETLSNADAVTAALNLPQSCLVDSAVHPYGTQSCSGMETYPFVPRQCTVPDAACGSAAMSSAQDWKDRVLRAERLAGEYVGTASDRVVGLTLVKVCTSEHAWKLLFGLPCRAVFVADRRDVENESD